MSCLWTFSGCALVAGMAVAGLALGAEDKEKPVYELRIYTAAPGKLSNLEARFRDHTDKIFRKHGMDVIGYWKPLNSPKAENTLIYIIEHKDRAAAKESWSAFRSDPEWKKVSAESEKDGKLLADKGVQSTYMQETDYSPPLADFIKAAGKDHVFELRTYTAADGKMDDMQARFRNHTDKLFRKHGLNSLAYWTPLDEPKSKNTLIYILSTDNRDAAKKSWSEFQADPDWKAARDKSEEKGKLLAGPPESIYMKATDYSPIK